ncbi:MAG: protein kinase domain-containing protein [Tumebacillaceae bacterium]
MTRNHRSEGMNMMATWPLTSSKPFYEPGQMVTGLWYHKRYQVDKLLGSGATGEVYRVIDEQGKPYALKISMQSSEIALEHKILKLLQEVARGVDLGPLVFDLDDTQTSRGKAFFYVMEWVRGTDLPSFLQKRGDHWVPVLMLQLCSYLEQLHKTGYCFGDLKADNCLVNEARGVLRLVDFGGVTEFGRGVKEYTEWYDRAWWGQGSRMAEESYDVFALTMIVIALLAPQVRSKVMAGGVPNFSYLRQMVMSEPRLASWRGLFGAVWSGGVRTVDGFRQMLTPLVKLSVQAEERHKRRKPAVKRDWTDWLMYGALAALILVFCQIFLLH